MTAPTLAVYRVETSSGEHMRLLAIRMLTAQRAKIAQRSTEYDFSYAEQRELAGCDHALAELEAMAPTGPLLPRRDEKTFPFQPFDFGQGLVPG